MKGTVGAGSVYPEKVAPSKCPDYDRRPNSFRCDAVINGLEATKEDKKDGSTLMQIKKPIQKGTNISFAGEDTKKGTTPKERDVYSSGSNGNSCDIWVSTSPCQPQAKSWHYCHRERVIGSG